MLRRFLLLGFIFLSGGIEARTVSVMSYNVLNLFDTLDDPHTRDEDFTPDGAKRWTKEKLHQKMLHLAEIILSIRNTGRESCPDILGLAELENGSTLKLFRDKYLAACGYKTMVISKQHPDRRGIQVALLSKFGLAGSPVVHLVYKGGRFIQETPLQVEGHRLVIFMNHWKSRLDMGSGNDGSDMRAIGARKLKERVRHLQEENPLVDILALGDFNDEFENDSFQKELLVTNDPRNLFKDEGGATFWESSFDLLRSSFFRETEFPFYDETSDREYSKEEMFRLMRSTYYYSRRKEFEQIDHILLSSGLFDETGLRFTPNSFRIVRHPKYTKQKFIPIPFKMEADEGPALGASDHFPVLVRFQTSGTN